jgi:translation initiation factor IF-2
MAGKPIRLGKAASELNVGVSTLVEFLESKGMKIDSNPNTKLEEDQMDLLRGEFSADVDLKEQSKNTIVSREKRETLSLKDSREIEVKQEAIEEEIEEDETPINLEEIKRSVLEPVEVKPAPVESNSGINVVGKIDLDALNLKTRPDKKKVDPTPQPVVEETKPEPVVINSPEVKVVEVPKVEEPVEIETIRFERKILTGPVVLGKIELPVERPKTSNSNNNNKSAEELRRKRKRIKKIETPTPSAPKPGGFTKEPLKGKVEKQEIKVVDIQKEIKDTLARLSNQGGKSKASKNRRAKRDIVSQRRQEEMAAAEMEDKILKITEFVTVSELASMMNIQSTQVISACMSLGIFASINQRIES